MCRKGKKTWWLLALGMDVALVASLCFWRQLVAVSAYLAPNCMLRSTTGLLCPVCGGTHALVSLLHGHILLAFQYNWFVMCLVGYAALLWGTVHVFCLSGGRVGLKLLSILLHYRMAIGFGLLAGCFFILANLSAVLGIGWQYL